MNFEDEEYVRLYCKDTVTTNKIGWEGRLVLWELMRKVDCAGLFDLAEGDDEVEAISALTRVPEDIVRVGLASLDSRDVIRRSGASIVIVKFVEAQNARRSDRLRAQEYRDRKKLGLVDSCDETEVASHGVMQSNKTSLPALPCPASPGQAKEENVESPLDATALAESKAKAEKRNADVKAVFEAWKIDTAHTGAKLDHKRFTRIGSRLTEGFTVDQLLQVIKNRRNDPWLMGITSDRVYDGIETIFRDASQVERLLTLTSPAPMRQNFLNKNGSNNPVPVLENGRKVYKL